MPLYCLHLWQSFCITECSPPCTHWYILSSTAVVQYTDTFCLQQLLSSTLIHSVFNSCCPVHWYILSSTAVVQYTDTFCLQQLLSSTLIHSVFNSCCPVHWYSLSWTVVVQWVPVSLISCIHSPLHAATCHQQLWIQTCHICRLANSHKTLKAKFVNFDPSGLAVYFRLKTAHHMQISMNNTIKAAKSISLTINLHLLMSWFLFLELFVCMLWKSRLLPYCGLISIQIWWNAER